MNSIDHLFDDNEIEKEDFPEDKSSKVKISKMYDPILEKELNHLRYIIKKEEYSERGMSLTKSIVTKMTNHYPCWIYRKEYLSLLKNEDLFIKENEFINELILLEPKSFQTWEQKRFCIENIKEINQEKENQILNQIIIIDFKNYHFWSYKTWLTQRKNSFSDELSYIDNMLESQIYNNSVWSYRKFLVKHLKICKELEEDKIYPLLSSNLKIESIWNYIDDIYESNNEFSLKLNSFCEDLMNSKVVNRFILSFWLLNMTRNKNVDYKKVDDVITLLKEKYDCMRSKYWSLFKSQYFPQN